MSPIRQENVPIKRVKRNIMAQSKPVEREEISHICVLYSTCEPNYIGS